MATRGRTSRPGRSARPGVRRVEQAAGESLGLPARAVPVAALAVAIAVATVGSQAYWLCVPVAVLAAAISRTRVAAALLTLLAVAAAAAPALADARLGPLPPGILALAVPALSAYVARLVRERLEAGQAALHALTRLDPLTGLANRRALDDRLGYEIARHRRHGRSLALLVMDLDDFKQVNERFGHPGGDEILRHVGDALGGAVREQDTVARLGGDEFCVLAPETGEAEAVRLEERLREAVDLAAAGFPSLSGSIGWAIFPDDGGSAAQIMAAADAAQADDKRRRRRKPGRRPARVAA